jgi:hypothetical protein
MNTCLVGCLTFAAYLLFAGTVSVNELITAFLLSSFATVWTAIVRHYSRLRFAPRADAFSHFLRALIRLPAGAGRTGRALMRVAVQGGSPGRSQECRFRYGHTDARDRTRRALAVIFASLAPDRFVVDIVSDTETALLHDVLRRGRMPDREWLE